MKKTVALLVVLMTLALMLGIKICAEETVHERISFTVGTEEEKAYMLNGALWNGKDGVRYADAEHKILYAYDLSHLSGISAIELSGVIHQQLHLAVSTDGINYNTVYFYDGDSRTGLTKARRTFILTDFVELDDLCMLYIRITDSTTENGYGGAIRASEPLVLDVSCRTIPSLMHEEHTFTTNTEQEAQYLIKAASLSGENTRYADAANAFIYCFPIRNTLNVQSVKLIGTIYQQLHLEVSTDGVNYTTVYCYESDDPDDTGLTAAKRVFDLTECLDVNDCRMIYVRISDAYTQNGWGGAISHKTPVTLRVSYIEPTFDELNAAEMAVSEHRVPVFGCNTEWGGGYVLDRQNQAAGYAALSLILRGGSSSAAVVLDEAVDARGMDTLEFELYVSDVSVFDLPFSGYLTLSSAGREDAAALRWSIRAVLAAIEQKQSGWNHVTLPLALASMVNGGKGDFDAGSINYIGLGWTDMPAVACGLEWKVDSFCLTDREKAEKELLLVEKNWLIVQLQALDELIADGLGEHNFKMAARLTTNSRQALNTAGESLRSLLGELGLVAVLGQAEQAVAAYETAILTATPRADEAVVDPEPDPEQPTDFGQDDEPTLQEPSGSAWIWAGVAVVALGAGSAFAVRWMKREK